MPCRFTMACCWKECLPRTQERNCSEHHGERSTKPCDCMKLFKCSDVQWIVWILYIVQIFFIDRRRLNNWMLRAVTRTGYLISQTNCTDKESWHFQSLWKLVEISKKACILIWLNRRPENPISLRNSFFSS